MLARHKGSGVTKVERAPALGNSVTQYVPFKIVCPYGAVTLL